MEKIKTNYNPEVTQEDKRILGDKEGNLGMGKGQDMELKNRKHPVDFTGKDLDIPGRTLPEDAKSNTIKDEENQLYSQGGSGNESLEKSQDPMH